MDMQKGLITRFGEWWDEQQAHRHQYRAIPPYRHLTAWLPSRGNVIFTLTMIGLLALGQSVGALPLGRTQASPDATSTGIIAYQGRLADSAGSPLTGAYNMIFRLYSAASGGTPLWEEQWTGSNSVAVSDGLFNVMLGSLTPIPQSVVTGQDQLFLGITVGTDDEMAPRVQLGSVPYATQALTVPDGSVSTTKIADGAVTQAKLGADVSLVPPDGSVTTAQLADGAVTSAKLNVDNGLNVTGDVTAGGEVGAARLSSVASRSDNTDLALGNMGRHRWQITTLGSQLQNWDVEETWMHFGQGFYFVQLTFGLQLPYETNNISVPANSSKVIHLPEWQTQELAGSRFATMNSTSYLSGVSTYANLIDLTHWNSSATMVDFIVHNGIGGVTGAVLSFINPSSNAATVRSFSIQGFVQMP